jgi:hypothetical protein
VFCYLFLLWRKPYCHCLWYFLSLITWFGLVLLLSSSFILVPNLIYSHCCCQGLHICFPHSAYGSWVLTKCD